MESRLSTLLHTCPHCQLLTIDIPGMFHHSFQLSSFLSSYLSAVIIPLSCHHPPQLSSSPPGVVILTSFHLSPLSHSLPLLSFQKCILGFIAYAYICVLDLVCVPIMYPSTCSMSQCVLDLHSHARQRWRYDS